MQDLIRIRMRSSLWFRRGYFILARSRLGSRISSIVLSISSARRLTSSATATSYLPVSPVHFLDGGIKGEHTRSGSGHLRKGNHVA
jgi:hypothetical protein